MAEILDHGQQLDLRSRRGADFVIDVQLFTDDTETTPLDITGASVVGRIFAPGQPDIYWGWSVDGPNGMITLSVPKGTTRNMQQDWEYTCGYRSAGGQTTALLFGFFRVAQESL